MQTSAYKDQIFAPYEWYRSMRATQPVFHEKQYNTWHVFRYADVLRVLSEHTTFSSDPRTLEVEIPREAPILSSILRMDPPRHRQLRNLATLAFTPRMVAKLAPRIRAITDELLNVVPSTGEMDVVRDLAYPLPVTVIAELLGIPAEKREDFKRWSDTLVSNASEEDMPARMAEIKGMYAYFAQVLEAGRRQPQDDPISPLQPAGMESSSLIPIVSTSSVILIGILPSAMASTSVSVRHWHALKLK